MDIRRIFDEAFRLPAEIRAALAAELLGSLDGAEVDADREAAWTVEIQKRLEAYDRGEITARSGNEVLTQLHAVARGQAT